jgi:hypothetical protein
MNSKELQIAVNKFATKLANNPWTDLHVQRAARELADETRLLDGAQCQTEERSDEIAPLAEKPA